MDNKAVEPTADYLSRQIKRLALLTIVAIVIFLLGTMNWAKNIRGVFYGTGFLLFVNSLFYILKYKKTLWNQAKQRDAVKQAYVTHIEKNLIGNLSNENVQHAIKTASGLPLNDAAFYLWTRKRRLERDTALPLGRKHDVNSPEGLRQSIQDALVRINFEANNADIGIVFYWLKESHPRSSDANLRDAIKRAVKMKNDCAKYFSYAGEDLSVNVQHAMQVVRKENPGFQESSYDAAANKLHRDMM